MGSSGTSLTISNDLINQGYGNIYVTVSIAGAVDTSKLGIQIGNEITWGVVVPNGQANGYWVICNAGSVLANGETKTFRIVYNNSATATVTAENILMVGTTYTITRK